MRHLGLDVGGTNIKRVILEDDRIAESDFQPTRSEDGVDAVLARLAALAREAGAVDSVGVALPGIVDEQGRAVLLPNLYGDWAGQPIAEPLSDALDRPVRLINDGHAFALAEARIGGARGADDVLCIVMIETRDAVARVDEILSVPGVDAVYVGPADLSITLGLPPAPDHDASSFTDAIARILEGCRSNDVVPGIAGTQKTAPKRIEQGFLLVEVASDARLLGVGAGEALHAVDPDTSASSRSAYL